MRNKLAVILFALITLYTSAQTDTTEVVIDSVVIDTVKTMDTINIISNTSELRLFFEKLRLLEEQKAGKVNIVHIGDSHIQADIFSGTVRKNIQMQFGNAGSGFTFPHKLAKTNGSSYIKYTSTIDWDSRRNIYPPEQGWQVGLSGIGLQTKKDFIIEAEIRDTSYTFNTVKIITPYNEPLFDMAYNTEKTVMESEVPKVIKHTIKKGESLSVIAQKYGTTVSTIKRENNLRSDNIWAGKTLLVPTGEMEKQYMDYSRFMVLPLENDTLSNFFNSTKQLSKIYLLPAKNRNNYVLNGLVLEKDAPGILYHSIGVNGAKASDYNKYPLFFEQLPALSPDLIIISLGTNESFDKLETTDYMQQLNIFIENIRASTPDADILVMTPPPSLFKRRYPNTFVASYAEHIQMQETKKQYASWDMFTVLGGLYSVNENAQKGLLSKDRVHYSVQGYTLQGNLFVKALMEAYENFKQNSK